MQYKVAYEHGTEPPFRNEFHDQKTPGLYKSIVSGEVLFSSNDKYDSQSGWPSFTQPVSDAALKETKDNSVGMVRVEVSCDTDGIHLGHVFDDGPADRGGLRYCINSASLKFVPVDELSEVEKQKYGFN